MNKNQQELYKQLTRQIFEQAWSKANFDGLDDLIDPNALFHIHSQTVPMGAEEPAGLSPAGTACFQISVYQ
jgi:hypothetical protein